MPQHPLETLLQLQAPRPLESVVSAALALPEDPCL